MNTGIRKTRIKVRTFGMFMTSLGTHCDSILVAMQGSIYLCCQFFADTGCLGNFHGAGAGQLLEATKVLEQLPPPLWPYPGDTFQGGCITGLAAPLAVAGDGKAVRLVADMLDEMQRGGMAWQYQFIVRVVQVQGFHTRLAGNAFGYAQQGQIMDGELLKHLDGHVHLPFTAINQ